MAEPLYGTGGARGEGEALESRTVHRQRCRSHAYGSVESTRCRRRFSRYFPIVAIMTIAADFVYGSWKIARAGMGEDRDSARPAYALLVSGKGPHSALEGEGLPERASMFEVKTVIMIK